MPIEDWFRNLNLPGGNAQDYGNKFIDHGMRDEQELPKLGLTRDDLRELNIKVGHRQPYP